MSRSIRPLVFALRSASVVAILAGGIGIPSAPAMARQAIVVGAGPGAAGHRLGGQFAPPVTTSQLEGYAQLLSLSDEQRDSAKELLDAMNTEFAKISAEHRDALSELQADFQETHDAQVFMKSMPGIMKKFKEKRSELESGFLEDLKLTLNPDQAARWPSLERMRRRDLSGNGAMLSGESVDLVRLVDDLNFAPATKAEIAPVLERYEIDFDRALSDREKLLAEQQDLFQGGRPPDPQTMMERMKDQREQSVKVRDVNRSFARQIQSLLPADDAQRFEDAVQKASFPQVYASGHTLKSIDAAMGFDDLAADQKAALKEIKDAYIRESEALNEKWAQAIEADEMDPNSANIAMMGGQTMRIMTRDGDAPDETPLTKASSARRDLDARTLDRAKSLLSPDQQTRLPKRGSSNQMSEDAVPQGDAMIMEVTESHDGVNEPQQTVRVSRPSTGESTEVTSGGGGTPSAPPPPPTPPAPTTPR